MTHQPTAWYDLRTAVAVKLRGPETVVLRFKNGELAFASPDADEWQVALSRVLDAIFDAPADPARVQTIAELLRSAARLRSGKPNSSEPVMTALFRMYAVGGRVDEHQLAQMVKEVQAAKRARFIEAAERAHDALLQRNPADFRGLLADTRRGRADRILHGIAAVDPKQTAQFAKYWPEGVDEGSFVKAEPVLFPLGFDAELHELSADWAVPGLDDASPVKAG